MYRSRLKQIAAHLDEEIDSALRLTANAIAQGAQDRAPHDSGDLEASIHVEKTDDGYAVIAGNDKVFYGHLVEHGTSHSPPKPFLIPAAESERDNLGKRGKDALKDI